MLGALAVRVEDDVGDLLVFAIDFAGVVVDGVDFDGLAEGVIVAGLGEVGFAGGKFGDDLVDREVLGRGGVERAEALLRGGGQGERSGESEGNESGAEWDGRVHGQTPVVQRTGLPS